MDASDQRGADVPPRTAATALRPTRRTRFICISDTHNSTVKLPKGDVLIHAGDLTNQGSYSELSKAVQWLEKADFEAKIVIAGNHDITLDQDFYSRHGSSFHNQSPQDPARCLSLLTASRTITYLQHSSAAIRLDRPGGPGTEFTVFGSPYCPEYGTWAFMYPRSDQKPAAKSPPDSSHAATEMTPTAPEQLWAAIPPDTDILVTHTPAYTHCDDAHGCADLQRALATVRPRLHVCGHVHQGRGAERVRWDTDDGGSSVGDGSAAAAAAAAVAEVEAWEDPHPDPASAKISLVDLTARGGRRPLDFHDGVGSESAAQAVGHGDVELTDGLAGGDDGSQALLAQRRVTAGQPACASRQGRKETCVVNCAIVATGYPHIGGKRFNKPIVVDIDLPVWR